MGKSNEEKILEFISDLFKNHGYLVLVFISAFFGAALFNFLEKTVF